MTDYSKKTNAELVEVLKTRSLPHTGKKADLVARLQQDDDKSSAPASATKPIDNAEDVIDWDDDEPAEAETVAVAVTSEGANSIAADETVAEPVAAPAPTAAESEAAPATTTETAPVEAEKKPAVDYTRGLPATELEEELRKRKARAEKFGTVEDSATALKEAEKAVLRAKRFATGGASETSDATKTNVGVKGLDEALPSEISRNNNGKRVRNDRSGPGGKRQNLGRRQQRGNGQTQNQNQNQGRQGNGGGQRSHGSNRNQNQNRTGGAGNKAQGGVVKSSWNDKDSSAMEARKKRFATAT